MTKDETLGAIIAGAKANGSWDKKYPDDDKKAQPVQEPPSEWAGIKAILDEYGLQAIDFVADWKAAQPVQPAQEPVAVYGYCPECGAKGVQRERRPDGNDKCINGHTYPSSKALAQPEQEPEAWYDKHGMITHDPFEGVTPLYTTPPKRPWVGLTDEEREEILESYLTAGGRARAIEKALKEKNT